jgi:hypothetical protein
MLPASQRLKNYLTNDIKDLSDFDGMFLQSYDPVGLSKQEEDELFGSLARAVKNMTSSVTEDKFSDSITDTDLPETVTARLNTRDILKQKIEDCCAVSDNIGNNGTKQFGQVLDDFQEWCAQNTKNKDGAVDGKIIPMTKSKYQGTAKRVFNTHHMG